MNRREFLASAAAMAAAPTIVGKAASDASVYARKNRLHEGIPSVAVDPKTGRLWATW